MDLTPEKADRYVRDLMTLRNQRLSQGLDIQEFTFGDMVADAINSLELVYVAYRGILDEADPTGDVGANKVTD